MGREKVNNERTRDSEETQIRNGRKVTAKNFVVCTRYMG